MANDPWHTLICKSQSYREVSTRHHAVNDALYRTVLLTGGQAVREVKDLQAGSVLAQLADECERRGERPGDSEE